MCYMNCMNTEMADNTKVADSMLAVGNTSVEEHILVADNIPAEEYMLAVDSNYNCILESDIDHMTNTESTGNYSSYVRHLYHNHDLIHSHTRLLVLVAEQVVLLVVDCVVVELSEEKYDFHDLYNHHYHDKDCMVVKVPSDNHLHPDEHHIPQRVNNMVTQQRTMREILFRPSFLLCVLCVYVMS